VYTISGAEGLGAGALDTITSVMAPGYATNKALLTAAAMRAVSPPSGPSKAAPSVSPVRRLQSALKSLGTTKGDPTLTKLKVDGVVGPGTTQAVNYAIAQKYVVMPSFPRPELTVQHVRQFASGIAAAVEAAVRAGGGTLVQVAERAPRARGGGAAFVPAAIPDAPPPDRKWVWWVVGGLGVLVVLSIAAKAVRGKSSRRKQRARDDDED